MNQVRSVVRQAGVRVFASNVLTGLVVLSTVAIIVIGVLRLLERAAVMNIDWTLATYAALGSVVAVSIIGALVRWPAAAALARRVDEGAGLKETLSTALHVSGQSDAWSGAIRDDAARVAGGVRVGQAVPVRLPRMWYAPMVAALSVFVVWMTVPKFDLLGKRAEAELAEAGVKERTKAEQEAKTAKAKVEELIAKVEGVTKGEGDEASKAEPQNRELKTPEEIRRAAIRSLTDMKQKLEAVKGGEKLQAAQLMLEKLKQLRTPGSGPLTDMASALAKGDISAAKSELQKLAQDMGAGKTDAQSKQKLEEQLNKLAGQMEKVAKDKEKLEQALQKAGLDKALASDPQKLSEAMKSGEGVSAEQKESLENAAQAQKQASEALSTLAQAMQQMAQQCQNPSGGQQGENGQKGGASQEMAQAMESVASAMSQMEMAQSDLNNAQAALNEAQKQLQAMSEGMGQCDSPGMGACDKGGLTGEGGFGDKNQPGDGNGFGRGGAGVSQGGGGMGEQAAAERWEKIKAKTPDSGGPTIGTMLVQGEQVKGESRQAFASVATAAEQEATEALENNVIERQYHDLVKHYFGELAKKSDASGKKPDAKDGKPAAEPAKKP